MKVMFEDKEICSSMKVASSFMDRMIGLMFRKDMYGFDGLLIKNCNSIHTFFMRYALDVVFLDKELKVVKVYRNIKPWRATRIVWGARQALEVKAGLLPEGLEKGKELVCIN
jgi:uncharacterized membrane protein (UPF0127 family)